MFEKYPNLKEKLWGSEFWSKGYFMSTVGKHGDEQKLRNYVVYPPKTLQILIICNGIEF